MKSKLNKNQSSLPLSRNVLVNSIDHQPKYTFSMLYKQWKTESDHRSNSSSRCLTKLPKIRINNNINTNHSNDFSPNFNPEKFNVMKKINSIRKQTRDRHLDPLKPESNVVFSNESAEFVFESSNLLKALQKRKDNSLLDEVSSVSVFLTERKETSIKNLLIKLLNSEKNTINTQEQESSVAWSSKKLNWDNFQKLFDNITESQKKSARDIENYWAEILRNRRELEEVMKMEVIESHNLSEEIAKILEQWDTMRICAKFVNHVMGEDVSKYEKEIPFENIIDLTGSKDGFSIEYIAERVINDYSFLWKDKKTDVKIKLNDPSVMTLKWNEQEDKIWKQWELLHSVIEKNKSQKNEYDICWNEWVSREEMHKKEYDYFNYDWNSIDSTIQFMSGNNIENNANMIDMIKDLESTIYNCEDLPMTRRNKLNTLGMITRDWMNKIKNTENKMNDLIQQLEEFSKDPNLFYEIVNNRKTNNKDNKQRLAKIKLKKIQQMKRERAEERFNRIIIKSRKTGVPYHNARKDKVCDKENEDTHMNDDIELTFE